MPGANAIDLTTVGAVKAWASIEPSNTKDDAAIQGAITGYSATFLIQTGNAPSDLSFPTESPFVGPIDYQENYDGNGSDTLWTDHRPINKINTLQINGDIINPSTAWNMPGYIVDKGGESVRLRGGGGAGSGFAMTSVGFPTFWGSRNFVKGVQNIFLDYVAGYSQTPFDIVDFVNKVVNLNYRRRDWVDLVSKAQAGGMGTLSYRNWEMPPEYQRVIMNYTRYAWS